MLNAPADHIVCMEVRVTGLVQGVGFRPFVHRTAVSLGLVGTVANDGEGVRIEVEGPAGRIDDLLHALAVSAPVHARVEAVSVTEVPRRHAVSFSIADNEPTDASRRSASVAPDLAVCSDCVRELLDRNDRRHRYPFVTCTNCGPRFTITRSLPYDRPNTTMARFELCNACRAEYDDPADRRFHAQPLACPECGPSLRFEGHGVAPVVGTDAALAAAHQVLAAGGTVAVKGLGGYHLVCDARSGDAVARLRERKRRPGKPLAVMARDLDVARTLADLDAAEIGALTSPAAPVVLAVGRDALPSGVTGGNHRLGLLLPYTPLHHLLFHPVPGHPDEAIPDVVVMTSGNLADEPICFDEADARHRLAPLVDAFVHHDRPIQVPCDDSVVVVVDGRVVPIRRSRGYAPLPVTLPAAVGETLATGGELKHTFCIARGRRAWMSQHIGDMGSLETLSAFERCLDHLGELYGIAPDTIVHDLHPGYQTTAWAERRAGAATVAVQHHHAHLGALLAEHAVAPDETVIGVVFDGTGYGTDGTIWGGEILCGGYASFERFSHLATVALPGGDATVRQPRRAALAHLRAAGVAWDDDLAPVGATTRQERAALARQLDREVHSVPTSSIGRLFDAVASILGLAQTTTYEAQAAMALEALAASSTRARPYRFDRDDGVFSATPVIRQLVADVRARVPAGDCAAGFHRALVEVVADTVADARRATGSDRVGLSGGVFQNVLLTNWSRERLERDGHQVLTHAVVPPNDAGIALGQLAVCAARSAAARGSA